MKKILAMLLMIAMCLSLCGCGRVIGAFLPKVKLPSISDMLEDNPAKPVPDTIVPETSVATTPTPLMPSCENEQLSFVKAQLSDLDVRVELSYAYSDTVAEGCVISQSIPAGTEVVAGDSVLLIISKGADICPYDYTQKLTVTASSGSSYGVATLYEWANGDWQQIAVYNAVLGKNGIGPAAEGSQRTPQGTHTLGVVLSANTVRTGLDTYMATGNTCVVDDANSGYYNRIMEKSQVPSGTSFDQIGKSLASGTTYAMIYIEHNGNGFSSENVVAGKGSAIGIRGRSGTLKPTYGDVDISASDMIDLLSRLDIDKNPVIEITVS